MGTSPCSYIAIYLYAREDYNVGVNMQEIIHEVQDHAMEVAMHYSKEAKFKTRRLAEAEEYIVKINDLNKVSDTLVKRLEEENIKLKEQIKKLKLKLKTVAKATEGE